MKLKKYIYLAFLLCVFSNASIYYKNETTSIAAIDEFETGDTDTPVHTEYDGIAIAIMIGQVVLIGGGVLGYLIYKKKKDAKEKETQKQNSTSTSNQIVFYSSYDTAKNDEVKRDAETEIKPEVTPVFTSTSTFSTSSIVNGPNQNSTTGTNNNAN